VGPTSARSPYGPTTPSYVWSRGRPACPPSPHRPCSTFSSSGAITAEQHEAAARNLIKQRIGDMSFDETRLLEFAEDES
jgi:hypothetical protein